MRPSTLALLLLFCTPLIAFGQSRPSAEGRWSGSIGIPGSPLAVSVEIRRSGDAWTGSVDIPAQSATGLPLKVEESDSGITFEISGVPGRPTFHGGIHGDRLEGTFVQGGASFPFELIRQTASSPARESGTAVPADAQRLDSVRIFLRGALEKWHVPGVAVAIVRNDSVLMAEGFGFRDVEHRLPMTARTLMPIGSSTKAFTSFLIGTLVADRKLDWNEPVIEYLPEFRLKKDEDTREIRVRDLLTHASGLPRHDLMWYGSRLTRREIFDRLRYLEPSAPVRTVWQYQNLMYMTAGVLAEKVSGRSWEDLLRERILDPLGMERTTTSLDTLKADADHAVGYEWRKDSLRRMEYRDIQAVGPAGSIVSSAEEMAKWVMLHLGHGTWGGRELISQGVLDQILAPQMILPSAPSSPAAAKLLFNLYAMGWMEHAYRGSRLLEHGGNIDGFSALVSFMPERHLGVVMLTNRNGTGLPNTAMLTIYDLLAGTRDIDWEQISLGRMNMLDSLLSGVASDDVVRVSGTKPSHPLADFTGEYEHPAYGVVRITQGKGGLVAEFHGATVPLEHYHYDVFQLKDESVPFNGIKLQFQADENGDVQSVSAPLEPSVEPIKFDRRPTGLALDSIAALDYVGTYSLLGQDIRIQFKRGSLVAVVPGQPEYELLPLKSRAFSLKGLEGYSVRFSPKTGRADNVSFVQPNGTFTGKRATKER